MAQDEILVVGAGPVGLTLAAELKRHGAKCRIIDKNIAHAADSRAVGIHARTLEVFEDMGLIDRALKEGVKAVGINLHSKGSLLVHSEFKQLDSRYNFVLDLPQSHTEPMLIDHLKTFGIDIERGVELNHLEQTKDQVDVMLKHGERSLVPETFGYVVGCDGARSSCRHLLEVPFPGDEYPSFWVVFDTALEWPYDSQELHLFLHEEGLSAFFPLPEGRMRVTCELLNSEMPKITYDDVSKILQKRVSAHVKLKDPKDLSPFIIHHRQAKHYQVRRVFLAGDAAHIHSPAGGQGMNTGIQDAYNLAWKLALVQKGLAPESLLQTYHQERYPIAKWVLSITDRITRMMTTKNRTLGFLRDAVLSLMDHMDSVKTQLPKRFSQLYLTYEHNAILYRCCEDHHPQHVQAGHRAPDHEIEDTRLFKLFQGTHHTLLLFTGKKPTAKDLHTLGEVYSFVENHYPSLIKSYLLVRNEEDLSMCSSNHGCFSDREPSVHSHYGVEKATAMLVRPDGYVGFVNSPPEIKDFKAYFKALFG